MSLEACTDAPNIVEHVYDAIFACPDSTGYMYQDEAWLAHVHCINYMNYVNANTH